MNSRPTTKPDPIRLVFELARADHPRLYDDLIQFQKGTKRINRLRVLAYDGLLAQGGHIVSIEHVPHRAVSAGGEREGGIPVTNDLFVPSLAQ